MNLYKFQYYWWLTHSLYTHKSSNLKPWGHKHKHRESQVYFDCRSQAQINVRIAWGRAFSENRTCGSIAVVIHWEIRAQTKVRQLSPDYLCLCTRKLQAFVFLQNHFRQRDPRKFIMLKIRVSCNESSSFIINAIPKIKLHPVSQFFYALCNHFLIWTVIMTTYNQHF